MFCSAAPISTRLYINSQNRCCRYLFKNLVTVRSPNIKLPSLSSPPRTMAVGTCALSSDDVVIKSPTDRRLYRFVQLANGLCALLVHDPEIYSAKHSGDGEAENTEDEDEDDDDDDDDEDEEDSGKDEDEDEDEDDGDEEVKEPKGSAQKKAAAAMCVGIGSFADPYEAQGLAHFLGFQNYFLQLFCAFE